MESLKGDGTDVYVSDPSEVGRNRRRARFTRVLHAWTYDLDLTAAEKVILDTFYETTLSNGVLTFNWTHPLSGTSYEVRFIGRPQETDSRTSGYRVQVGIEEI